MAAVIGGRSAFLCAMSSTATRASNSTARRVSLSARPSLLSFSLSQTRTSPPPSSLRFMRRELSSLLPFHSAIASACLVSKLSCDLCTSSEGRFANYLSPI